MEKFISSIGLLALGLTIGQGLKLFVERGIIRASIPVSKYIKKLQNVALLVLLPIINLGAFWIVRIVDLKLILLPILGIGALVIGGFLGLAAARLLKLEKKKIGSMYVTSSFSNIGSFGGLICFVFFGESSYAFISMYRLFEEFYYYTIGFSIAKLYGKSEEMNIQSNKILRFILDPYILVTFSSMVIGVCLNVSNISRPVGYSTFNSILIPLSSFLLVLSVGFRMRVNVVRGYLKECLWVAAIKFIAVPMVITSSAYLLGVGELNDGMVLKVILVLSAMPPAFNSLVPPQIFNLDIDLANSVWLFNTVALVIVLPILYMLQGMI